VYEIASLLRALLSVGPAGSTPADLLPFLSCYVRRVGWASFPSRGADGPKAPGLAHCRHHLLRPSAPCKKLQV